ncbi:hypothetical protein F4604DRAFT_1672286 [Suillus subluteus]|nr:hypothetical protein F4604DRAFT_1672286 [Suillus subluteus]
MLNSDATRRAVPRKPVILPVTSFAPRLQRPSPAAQRLLSRTNARRNDHPRDPLDFPATSPLPRNYSHLAQEITKTHSRMNPHENSQSKLARSPITQSRLHHLSSWWPIRIGHASLPIVDVPLALGKLRIATAGALTHDDDDLIRDEDYVSPCPPTNLNSRQAPAVLIQHLDHIEAADSAVASRLSHVDIDFSMWLPSLYQLHAR